MYQQCYYFDVSQQIFAEVMSYLEEDFLQLPSSNCSKFTCIRSFEIDLYVTYFFPLYSLKSLQEVVIPPGRGISVRGDVKKILKQLSKMCQNRQDQIIRKIQSKYVLFIQISPQLIKYTKPADETRLDFWGIIN